ncbi:MAG: hypothetical protein HXS52_09130 [Theionarchaea archaeon]|nr:hypothetical protein [Theionarchaea archaeon]MBU7038084.1 hypothetical protein [Theionarchaea archaeon]
MVLFGEVFRIGEMIALLTMIFSLLFIYRMCWKRKAFRKMVFAYFFFLLSAGFAVLREYLLYDLMREIEHLSLVISSSMFLYIAYVAYKNLGGG